MQLKRLCRHILTLESDVNDHLSELSLAVIKSSINATESKHQGEIRFVVEGALPIAKVVNNQTPRERAVELFSQLRVWDTEKNNGVLIYLLLADRAVEIVADRGIHEKAAESWQQIIASMQECFAIGRFEAGAVLGVDAVAAQLEKFFPHPEKDIHFMGMQASAA